MAALEAEDGRVKTAAGRDEQEAVIRIAVERDGREDDFMTGT